MRDPERIHDFCSELEELWSLYPDFRFGQLVLNITSMSGHSEDELWNLEEDVFLNGITKFKGVLSKNGE